MTTTVILFADTHTNHKVGLNQPQTDLDEGDNWGACKAQRWLYGKYESCLEYINKHKQGEAIGVLAGDFVEIDEKDRTHQLISRNPADAVSAACEVLEPFATFCKRVYFIRGTEAHVGKSGSYEELVARDFLNAVKCPDTGRRSWWHLPLTADGVSMDIGHHPKGGNGGRLMNSQSVVDRLASDTLFEYASMDLTPPQLVIRAHLHRYLDSRDAFRVRGIILPPMCLLGAYARRLGINENASVGCVMIYCDRGKYEVEAVLFQPERTKWVKA